MDSITAQLNALVIGHVSPFGAVCFIAVVVTYMVYEFVLHDRNIKMLADEIDDLKGQITSLEKKSYETRQWLAVLKRDCKEIGSNTNE